MIKDFIQNPELRRNAWLECSQTRMISMPIVLGLVYYAAMTFSNDYAAEVALSLSMFLFTVIVYLWGTNKASTSILEEVHDSTWDFQRLSALSAMQLTVGKLFGSTIYQWYGGLLVMGVFILSYLKLDNPAEQLKDFMEVGLFGNSLFFSIFYMVTFAIFSHAIAILLSLQDVYYARTIRRFGNFLYLFAALFLSYFIFSLFMTFELFEQYGTITNKDTSIYWYGLSISAGTLTIFSVLFFLFWAVMAVYRSMRRILQYTNTPWVWLVFLVSLNIYMCGFIQASNVFDTEVVKSFVYIFVILGLLLPLGYLTAWQEAQDIIAYRKVLAHLKEKKSIEVFNLLPMWVVAYLLALPVMFYGILLWGLEGFNAETGKVVGFLLAAFLFTVRDLIVLHILYFRANNKRAGWTFILYALIVYVLFPLITSQGGDEIQSWFYPFPEQGFFTAVIPVAIQVALVGTILMKIMKKRKILQA